MVVLVSCNVDSLQYTVIVIIIIIIPLPAETFFI
jgi:hypothetical protein